MEVFGFIDVDFFDDESDILEIIEFGFPRQIYTRTNHFEELDDLSFYRRYRLTKKTVLYVLDLIEDKLTYPFEVYVLLSTHFLMFAYYFIYFFSNNCVSPLNQLLVSLRFYATGNHLMSVADTNGMRTSTVSRIIKRVSEAIAALYDRFIKLPTSVEDINTTRRNFFDIALFPRVLGAVDGTHIRIRSPGAQYGI